MITFLKTINYNKIIFNRLNHDASLKMQFNFNSFNFKI